MKIMDLDIKEPRKDLSFLIEKLDEKQVNRVMAKNRFAAELIDYEIRQLKIDMAWRFLNCGEYAKALDVYRSLSWKSDGENKYLGIGIVLHKTKGIAEALKFFSKGLKRFPMSYALLVAIGNIYHEMDNFEISLKYFDKALTFKPDDKAILFSKANALYGLGFYEDAFKIYESLIKAYPDEPSFVIQSGYCCLNTGNPENASKYFESLINTDQADANVYNGLYCAYIDMDLRDDALKIAEEAVTKLPDEEPFLYYNLGAVYLEHGWRTEARAMTIKGIENFPEDNNLKDLLEIIDEMAEDPDRDNKGKLAALMIKMTALAGIIKNLRRKRNY